MPSRGFTKLDSGIVDSTLWMKDNDVLRESGIAMLAKADSFRDCAGICSFYGASMFHQHRTIREDHCRALRSRPAFPHPAARRAAPANH